MARTDAGQGGDGPAGGQRRRHDRCASSRRSSGPWWASSTSSSCPSGSSRCTAVLLSPRDQRLGDMAAGTIVVRERTAGAAPQAAWFRPPYGWDQYTASLDVTALDDDTYGLIRTYLLRVPDLSRGPATTWRCARQPGGGPHRAHTAAHVHPHAFLVCVAARWQRLRGARPLRRTAGRGACVRAAGRLRGGTARRRAAAGRPPLVAPSIGAGGGAAGTGCETRPVPDATPYLDHAATTPLRPEARAAMLPWLGERFGNPSGAHRVARAARQAVDEARDASPTSSGCRPGEVVFTSGGTEADNLAVAGVARRPARPGAVQRGRARRRAAARRAGRAGAPCRSTADGVVDLDALAGRADAGHDAGVGDGGQQRGRHRAAGRRGGRGGAPAGAAAPPSTPTRCRPRAWLDLPAPAGGRRPGQPQLAQGRRPAGRRRARGPARHAAAGAGRSAAARSASCAAAPTTSPASSAWPPRSAPSAASREATAARVAALRDRLADGLLAAVPGAVETGAARGRRPAARRPAPVHPRRRERGAALPAGRGGRVRLGGVGLRQRGPAGVARAGGHGRAAGAGRRGAAPVARVVDAPTPTSTARLAVIPAAVARLREAAA